MVRLLPRNFSLPISELNMFQSHNGAIAAAMFWRYVVMALWFQSHNGAIAATPQEPSSF